LTHLFRRRQRGSAALTVVMLLLFSAALVALYLNRNLLVDQRNSANQMRATLALEAAEAGVEWATAMINAPGGIDTQCRPKAASAGFKRRYVLTAFPADSNVNSATNAFPGCRLTANGLNCSCPDVPASPTANAYAVLGTTEEPSFSVQLSDVLGQPDAVRVVARGCTGAVKACNPDTFTQADATARVTVLLKLRRMQVPASPLTCGGSCTVGGSYNIENKNVPTNGVLIDAGTTVTVANGTTLTTLQGVATRNAIVSGDRSLSDLTAKDPDCSKGLLFQDYFGKTIESYRTDPTTKQISCGASDCESQLKSAYDAGWRAFYFNSDLTLKGNDTFGSAQDPVMLVTPNAMDITGSYTIYGLLYSNSADLKDIGTGSANIRGAQVTCADYRNNGNGSTIYDAQAMDKLQKMGAMVRVPGSWRDF
jgi:Tfp pilus assembly protein PilX